MQTIERTGLLLVMIFGVLGAAYFGWWWFQPERVSSWPLYILLTVSFWYSILRYTGYWVVLFNVKEHQHKGAPTGLTVDAFTTAAPGEPVEMTQRSLLALKAMTYPHTTYLLDDSNNPVLKAFCEREGIVYTTRTNKKDAKCGNVNNALRQSSGDFVLIIDPDHIVEPHYLDRVLGHFDDAQVGFVQTTQAYYNQSESFVASGGAEQTYMFYGPVMQGLAGLGANPVIGTNCTFRRKALDDIGLYKPGLAEDLHTSMALHSKGWKGAYVPEILARGLTPADLGSFSHQQLKWSRGVMELLFNNFLSYAKGWTWTQKWCYGLSMSYYFESIMMLINIILPVAFFVTHQYPLNTSVTAFAWHFAPWFSAALVLFLYSQKWLCDPQERGLMLRGMFLHYLTFPFHLLGIFYAIVGRKIPYLPTAKTASKELPLAFLTPQIILLGLTLAGMLYSVFNPQKALESANNGMLVFAVWNIASVLWAVLLCVAPQSTLVLYNTSWIKPHGMGKPRLTAS